MANEGTRERAKDRTSGATRSEDDEQLGDTDIREAFGETIRELIDIDQWTTALDWEGATKRFREEIAMAVEQEDKVRATIRSDLLPRLRSAKRLGGEGGVYQATPEELSKVHEGLLFPGSVDAVDGTQSSYDVLPIEITQIGIAAVSYGGTKATFAQRIFRREIASKGGDPVKEAQALIERRDNRSALGRKDKISELGRRGIMTLAERQVLVDKCSAEWRMGHGSPAPYELLTGSGSMELLKRALEVLRKLIEDIKTFVFVPSAPREMGLLTIGNALAAGEYALLDDMTSRMMEIVNEGHYAGKYKTLAQKFVSECGPQIAFGLFRASAQAAPLLFYCHRDHAHIAARIALADSILRAERGFPMLLDVADVTCRSAFGSAGFMGLIQEAFAQSGAGFRYANEREMRG